MSPSWSDLARTLLAVAQRAGDVARRCVHDPELFALLLEEKPRLVGGAAAGPDFKTLADVLIQQMVVHAVTALDTSLGQRVGGEESDQFRGPSQQLVTIQVGADADATRGVLAAALPGYANVCAALAAAVHAPDVRTFSAEDEALLARLAHAPPPPTLDHLAIWVDPIDGTNEYVSAQHRAPVSAAGLLPGGIGVALVLIGVYDRSTGQPLLGVVHQPFWSPAAADAGAANAIATNDQKEVNGRTLWGVHLPDGISLASKALHADAGTRWPVQPGELRRRVVASRSEPPDLVEALQEWTRAQPGEPGVHLDLIGGGGYKLLAIAEGLAWAFLASQPRMYAWDTCAMQAILRAVGGDVVDSRGQPLSYRTDDASDPCHQNGVIAFRDPAAREALLGFLASRNRR